MIKTLLIVILAVALFGLAPSGIAQTQARSKDEKAIRSLILQRVESFNNKHEAPQSGAFTQDADFVNVYGMWRRGPAEIEKRQGERMKTVLRDAKITMQDLRIRFIRPDVAIIHETHELSGMRNDKGEPMPPQQELSIRVMVKEKGKWLISAFHNTIVRPGT